MEILTDAARLAALAAKGDEGAFVTLVTMEKKRMLRIAVSYLRSESDALEAIQETVCRAWLKRRDLKQPKFFATWLIRILINVCTDELRNRKKRTVVDDVNRYGGKGQEQQWHDLAGAAAISLDMSHAVDQLSDHYRNVIILKYYEDMTITAIAELLNKPDGTIRTWLHKALKQLHSFMRRTEEVPVVNERNELE
ncbi:hypothetical protein PAECIP111893_05148 [Paenibacillus plantiphilus]|uniref:RNA polymerase subunit sigma n=1 Tax=Paenibacillus plantiphilus TaxID=2905650 RepID=A0ABM9CW88_9BACL|nr:sigma-70 family RNA polymerase sigma factor [Paenibacillus plantiphilus]CAH1224580.1 hypothetical protein PAECIP111893_05148 [Paenibacillus plantiphilus]